MPIATGNGETIAIRRMPAMIDDRIDPSIPLESGLDEALQVRRLAYRSLNREGIGFTPDLLQAVGARQQRKVVAMVQFASDGCPHAVARGGDDGDLSQDVCVYEPMVKR